MTDPLCDLKARQLVLRAEMSEVNEEIARIESRPLLDAVLAVLQRYPTVLGFRWDQCAPWRDGVETSFEVAREVITVLTDAGEEEYGRYSDGDNPAHADAVDAFSEIMGRYTDEQFESWFGAESRVTVTRDQVTTEHYSDF